MLNWRPVREIEERTRQTEIEILRVRKQSEQIRKETEQIKKETEQIKKESELIRKDTEQIKKDTERLRQENARLRTLNIKTQSLLSSVDQICFPPECSSIPATTTEPDSRPSSPS